MNCHFHLHCSFLNPYSFWENGKSCFLAKNWSYQDSIHRSFFPYLDHHSTYFLFLSHHSTYFHFLGSNLFPFLLNYYFNFFHLMCYLARNYPKIYQNLMIIHFSFIKYCLLISPHCSFNFSFIHRFICWGIVYL